MAEFTYDGLKETYAQFQIPRAIVKVDGKDLVEQKSGIRISNIVIENSCGFEASQASFQIFDVWEENKGCFNEKDIKGLIRLGLAVQIAIGYSKTARTVFIGYIAQINYVHKRGKIPGIIVTCLDVRGAMMSGEYCKQLKDVRCYSEAMKKVMNNYKNFNNTKPPVIGKLSIFDSPDKSKANSKDPTTFSMEYNEESDYEFAIKAAKKFNYEFFVSAGEVVYRSARSNEAILMDMKITQGFLDLDVEYSSMGQVAQVEVRGYDEEKGEVVKAVEKSKSKTIIYKKAQKVIVDPTIRDAEEAKYRAQFLMNDNMYKFGTLRATLIGLPELTPGRFITLEGLDSKNQKAKFYIYKVVHSMDGSDTYTTHIVGKAIDDKLSK